MPEGTAGGAGVTGGSASHFISSYARLAIADDGLAGTTNTLSQ
jgi:hypothetical protein